jgi:hypothetical protein
MRDSWFARCLQGGGVHLNSGTVTITSSLIFGNTAYDVRAHLPIAVIGDSRFARCLQGGGVHVNSDTVTITSSSIYGNTAYWVRAHLQNSPSPSWKTHGLLVVLQGGGVSTSSGTVTITFSSIYRNTATYVRARLVPIALLGFSLVLRFCMQGGGVFVEAGTVAISSCNISGNTATYAVRAHAPTGPTSPSWGDVPTLHCDIAFPTPNPGA